ncbi:hypothetical protein BJ138DRAFT_1108232, partial [Hygrophoropsis aurantiaca]
DMVRARPAIGKQAARFDTVVVMDTNEAESTGVQGCQIGRLKVVFRLPKTLYGYHEAPASWPKEPLAYVEWYSRLKPNAEADHLMYSVTNATPLADNTSPNQIIPLSSIR